MRFLNINFTYINRIQKSIKFVPVFLILAVLLTSRAGFGYYADDTVDPSAMPADSMSASGAKSDPQTEALKSQALDPNDLTMPESTSNKSVLDKAGIYSVGGKLFIDRNVVMRSVTASSATIGALTTAGVTGTIRQVVVHTQTTSQSSTSSSYATTGSSTSFTPLLAGSTIYIIVQHPLRADNSGSSGAFVGGIKLFRDANNIQSWTNAAVVRTNPSLTNSFFEFMSTFIYKDNYNSTAKTYYSTQFANVNGAGTFLVDNTSTNPSTMWIIEVGP